MRRTSTAIAALLLLGACQSEPSDTLPPPVAEMPPAPAIQDRAEIVAAESARLNQFFEDKFQATLSRNPMYQTYLGVKTDYDKWNDVSDENAVREMEIQRADMEEMKTLFDYDLRNMNSRRRKRPSHSAITATRSIRCGVCSRAFRLSWSTSMASPACQTRRPMFRGSKASQLISISTLKMRSIRRALASSHRPSPTPMS